MPKQLFEPGSFRDKNGRVFYVGGKTCRALSEKAYRDWQALSATDFFVHCMETGKLVKTELIDRQNIGAESEQTDGWTAFLLHHTIPFVSYPYEWSFSMLKDAALLQLELLLAALNEDMILKDSSAYNIQWQGAAPVFIDIPSFEVLPKGEPWVGYRQFCQLFLFPLFLQAYKNIHFHPWLRGCIDGIDPVQINSLMSLRDKFRAGIFTNVYLQAKMQTRFGSTDKNVKSELKQAGFRKQLIQANVMRVQKLVSGLQWQSSNSQWSGYMQEHSYSSADQDKKAQFIEQVSESNSWQLVWDIGCNTGKFSKIAARHAGYVVAMDSDHLCIDVLYRSLKREGINNILPLCINLADASPNLGWRGQERKSLEERGKPDLILCLALIHHMVIGANIPLQDFIQWLASLGASLVIEFVSKDDVMVKRLLRNKEDQYDDYSPEQFKKYLDSLFNILECEVMDSGTRQIYYAEPKTLLSEPD